MKIDTAVRAVFDTEKRRPVRSSIATFLKQHSNRIPAGWRCSKMDAEAFLTFVSGLGLREDRDYTVVRSSLDPHAIQLKWLGDTAARLSQALYDQPSGWLDAVYACAHSLEPLPEGALTDTEGEPEESVPAETATPSLAHAIADRTLHIVTSVRGAEFPDSDEWISIFPKGYGEPTQCNESSRIAGWCTWYANTAPVHPRDVPPLAPMPVVEAYVRVCLKENNLPGWPKAPVFSSLELKTGSLDEQKVRELFRQVRMNELVPQGNLFTIPLEGQFCEGSSSPLSTYFTRNLECWQKQSPQGKAGAWVQFDTLVRPTVDAARFMLQPKDAAKYVRDLYRIAYGQDVVMSEFTRIAVHNLFPDVPGSEDITCDCDDEDYNRDLARRADEDTLLQYGLYYMGGLVIAAPGVSVRRDSVHDLDTSSVWQKQRTDLPTVNAGDPLDRFALRTDELGKEWFAIVHGSLSQDDTANLQAFRDAFSRMERNPCDIDRLCSIGSGSRFFKTLGSCWTEHSAFVGSICGILRAYSPLCLNIVEGSRTVVQRIWSGMTTDRSRNSEDQDAFPWVPSTPVVDQLLVDARSSPRFAENADRVTDALNRLHAHPECQFRFTERESGSKERRNCVVMVETNVVASKFLDGVPIGSVAELSERLKLAFVAPYVYQACEPGAIAAVSSGLRTVVDALNGHSRCSRIYRMAAALTASGYQDMFRDHVVLSRNGAIRYPSIDEFPVDVRVTWDRNDRLVILFSMDGEAAQFLRLMYRCDNKLPLATASYLKSRGKAPEFAFMADSSLPQSSNYINYLKAQMKYNGFIARGDMPASFIGGQFSPVYNPNSVCGLDWDQYPDCTWYDKDFAMNISTMLGAQ